MEKSRLVLIKRHNRHDRWHLVGRGQHCDKVFGVVSENFLVGYSILVYEDIADAVKRFISIQKALEGSIYL